MKTSKSKPLRTKAWMHTYWRFIERKNLWNSKMNCDRRSRNCKWSSNPSESALIWRRTAPITQNPSSDCLFAWHYTIFMLSIICFSCTVLSRWRDLFYFSASFHWLLFLSSFSRSLLFLCTSLPDISEWASWKTVIFYSTNALSKDQSKDYN